MAINTDYKGVEDGILPCITGGTYTYVAGRAVYIQTDGKLASPVADKRVLGLIKESVISGVVDEIGGKSGIYGSGKATVVLGGVCTVRQSVYNGTSYSAYNEALTYVAGDELYATAATGILTNSQPSGTGPNGITSLRVGRVLTPPSNAANGDPMVITVGGLN